MLDWIVYLLRFGCLVGWRGEVKSCRQTGRMMLFPSPCLLLRFVNTAFHPFTSSSFSITFFLVNYAYCIVKGKGIEIMNWYAELLVG